MLSDEELEALLAIFEARIDAVSKKYVELIGKHIADIGSLTASDLYRLKELKRMGANLDVIQRDIAAATKQNVADLQALIEKSAVSLYGDYEAYGIGAITSNASVLTSLRAQVKQTLGAMANLSNTTVVSTKYRECIDAGVAAVQSGVVDYKSAVRSTIRGMANDGLRVTYESGLTRRLDTAIRQNIIDAVKQINQAIASEVGEQIGADGVEISAHVDCAADHVEIQGKQFTLSEFERLQQTLPRPIGEWNCRHFAFPIVLGASEPAYSPEELANYKQQSGEQITIDGTTKSRYEWTQEQRKLETQVRYAKNEANAFKASGDDVGRRMAQSRINDIDNAYARITDAAAVPSRRERMAVAGFNRVKTPAQLASTALSKVVSSNGISVSAVSDHAFGRSSQRAVSIPSIENALTRPLNVGTISTDELGRPSQRFIGETATVNINPDTGVITTVWKTGLRMLKKYGGEE